jgi:hypothetical protein
VCRIWDTHNILQKTVVKPSTPSASRVGVTTVAYNSTGKLLAAGLADGTLQVRGGAQSRGAAALWVCAAPACGFGCQCLANSTSCGTTICCTLSTTLWGGGLLHVDMFAHNKSGIAYRDGNRRAESVVNHKW